MSFWPGCVPDFSGDYAQFHGCYEPGIRYGVHSEGGSMLKNIFGALATAGGILWWFGRGTIESWFFDKIVKVAEPHVTLSGLVEYGPPVAFFLMAVYLLWWAPQRQTASAAPPTSTPSPAVEAPLTTPLSEFITLREAATQAYSQERARKSESAHVAELPIDGKPKSPDDILQYFASHMCFGRGVPISGRRPPSTRVEEIPYSEANRYYFKGPDWRCPGIC